MRNESSFVSYSNYQAGFQEFSSGLKDSYIIPVSAFYSRVGRA